jgi:hypothetical protein
MTRIRIFVAAMLSLLSIAPATAQPITQVYRADSRPPEEIFQHGFTGRGGNLDVLDHALLASCTADDLHEASAFVAMTADESQATLFAAEQLEWRTDRGPDSGFWVYTIRADATFFSVPRVVERVVEAGYAQRQGYTPEDARIASQLLQTTELVDEAEVLSTIVPRTLVIEAYRVSLDPDGDLAYGQTLRNPSYIHENTQAESEGVPLGPYIPPGSLTPYDDAPPRATTCAMSCDGAHSAWQRAAHSGSTLQCKAKSGLTPLLLDIIND